MASWAQRLAKIARERPACCPECGSERVRFTFFFKPSAKQRQATEPYKELFYFAYNWGCCPPRPNSPMVKEAWTCRACGENWDEVFYPTRNVNNPPKKTRDATEEVVESTPVTSVQSHVRRHTMKPKLAKYALLMATLAAPVFASNHPKQYEVGTVHAHHFTTTTTSAECVGDGGSMVTCSTIDNTQDGTVCDITLADETTRSLVHVAFSRKPPSCET